MGTIKTCIPDSHIALDDKPVSSGDFESISEHACGLIREDHDRLQLRGVLIAGANSRQAGPADWAYFATLRQRISLALLRNAKPFSAGAGGSD